MLFEKAGRRAALIYLTIVGYPVFGQTRTADSSAYNWWMTDPQSGSSAGIALTKAYDLLKDRKATTVIVAVIDNGFDIDHEDLKGHIWTNPREIAGNGIDDDKNGYIDDVHGWNFRSTPDGQPVENEWAASTQLYFDWKDVYEQVDTIHLSLAQRLERAIFLQARRDYLEKLQSSKDSNDILFAYNLHYRSGDLIKTGSPRFPLTPALSHGTHVAGIIGAIRNNRIGIDGIDGKVLIMPIVATTAAGDEKDEDIAAAIRYAVDNGARIINMSFSKKYSPRQHLVDAAIRYAEKNDVLIVHAAGNDGEDLDSSAHYPTPYYKNGGRAQNVITVGWSRPEFSDRLAHPYSDYGSNTVDLFAPGSDIYSTLPANGYGFKSGSSMSTPVVSGIAALLMSYFPRLKATQVKTILLRSVFKPGTMVNKPGTRLHVAFASLSISGGIVNALNAVKMALSLEEKYR